MRERKEEKGRCRQKGKFTQPWTVPQAQISQLVSFRKYTRLLSSWSGVEWRGPREVLADQHPLPLLTGTRVSWGNNSPQLCVTTGCLCWGEEEAREVVTEVTAFLLEGWRGQTLSPGKETNQSDSLSWALNLGREWKECQSMTCAYPDCSAVVPMALPLECPFNHANPQRASLGWPKSISKTHYNSMCSMLVFNPDCTFKSLGELFKLSMPGPPPAN